MKIRYRINTLLFILIPILLLSSCNALKRGDFMRQSDNTLMFSEIGFHMSDNPELYRNAITEVFGNPSEIYIDIPYYQDDYSTPLLPVSLRLYFNIVGKDAIVLLDGVTEIQSGDIVDFHDGIATPYPRKLTIAKYRDGSSSPETNEIWIHVSKTITPKLMNPHQPDVSAPLTLEIAFVDERDNKVEMSSGTFDSGQTSWDGSRLEMPTAPFYVAGTDVFEAPDVRPYYPGNHEINIYDQCFLDPYGYYNQYGILNLNYDPPAIHLSNRTGAAGTGDGSKENPFFLWSEVFAELVSIPGAYSDIFIEATDIPYDTGSGIYIDDMTNGAGSYLGIYGGFAPGFETQYDVNDENRPQSILVASTQPAGGGLSNPGSVLNMTNVNNDFILNNLAIGSSSVPFGTALLLTGSNPKISGMTLTLEAVDPTDFFDGTALTIISSTVDLSNTIIIGKDGGTGISRGIYLNGSNLNLNNDCLVAGGNNLGSNTYGIDGIGSNINIWGGGIWAGYTDPITNNPADLETENIAINITGSNLRLESSWVHSADSSGAAGTVSTAIEANNSTAYISGSTLISGVANITYGLDFTDPTGNFELYNSVIDVPGSISGQAAGMKLENTTTTRISGNAIRVGLGANGTTVGIDLNGCPAVQIHNNLIWSDVSGDILGIRTISGNISDNPVRHNNFWDANQGTPVLLELSPGTQDNIYFWHSTFPTPIGNVSVPASFDMSYNFASEDLDMGRIIGNQPDDIVYGGEDISGIAFPTPPNYDKDFGNRTSDFGVGWSIGPYEYGTDTYLPRDIYVSQDTAFGDDKHPIGSIENPFESIQGAFNYVVGPESYGLCTIHVAEGTYDSGPGGLVLNTDIRLLGGYSSDFEYRDITGPGPYDYPAVITDPSSTASQIITINWVSSDTLIEGFTIKNFLGAGQTVIKVTNNASARIRSNQILCMDNGGGTGYGVWVTGGAKPKIAANHIFGGINGTSSYGVYIDGGNETQLINNVIHGGFNSSNWSYGVHIASGGSEIRLYNNTILAGDGATNAAAVYHAGGENPEIINNILIAGQNGGPANAFREITTPPLKFLNNLMLSGPGGAIAYESNIRGIFNDPDPTILEDDLIFNAGLLPENASGNRTDPGTEPKEYFLDYIPGTTPDEFIDIDNWHLDSNAVPEDAIYGGYDLSGNFTTDRDGKNRSAPWSIGAYEK